MASTVFSTLLDPFAFDLGIKTYLDRGLDVVLIWGIDQRTAVQPLSQGLVVLIDGLEMLLQAAPPLVMLVILAVLGWQRGGLRVALTVTALAALMGMLAPPIWPAAMTTLAFFIVIAAIIIPIGMIVGIGAAKSDLFYAIIRPIMDLMQSFPALLYLTPLVLFTGVGVLSAVLLTVIFALPPLIRMMVLGLRNIDRSVSDAGRALGFSHIQILIKIALPASAPFIYAGIGQMLFLSAWMVVIVSAVMAEGLGGLAVRALDRNEHAEALIIGLAIALLAMTLHTLICGSRRCRKMWWQRGPIGLLVRFLGR